MDLPLTASSIEPSAKCLLPDDQIKLVSCKSESNVNHEVPKDFDALL